MFAQEEEDESTPLGEEKHTHTQVSKFLQDFSSRFYPRSCKGEKKKKKKKNPFVRHARQRSKGSETEEKLVIIRL
jgi:hypothetical protein